MPEEIKMIFKALGVFAGMFLLLALFVYVKYQIPQDINVTKEEMINTLSYI